MRRRAAQLPPPAIGRVYDGDAERSYHAEERGKALTHFKEWRRVARREDLVREAIAVLLVDRRGHELPQELNGPLAGFDEVQHLTPRLARGLIARRLLPLRQRLTICEASDAREKVLNLLLRRECAFVGHIAAVEESRECARLGWRLCQGRPRTRSRGRPRIRRAAGSIG